MAQKHELFEFNAPKYVDFTKGIPEDTDDSYFEIAPEPLEIKEKVDDATEQLENASTAKETLENAATHTKIKELPAPMEESEASLPSTEQQPTSVQDSEEALTAREEQSTFLLGSEEPFKVTEQSPAGATGGEVQSASKGKRRGRRSSGVGVRQSPRLIAISKALRRSGARHSLGKAQISTSRTQDNQVKKVQPQRKGNRRVSGVSVISQEDKAELDTVATFQQKITKNKKRKEASGHRQPLKPTKPQEFHFATDQRLRKHQEEDPAPAPAPSALRPARTGPTRPQEFNFATDGRLKAKESVKGEESEATVEFAKSLRSSSTTSLNKNAGGRGPTIPQPFKLSEPRKPQTEEPKKFVSLAEMNYKYYVKTPLRFRSKRAGSTELSEETSKKPRGPTVPTTPDLATGRRRRSLSVMTHEEREQQEFEEAQKHAFKAKPVNKKVFEGPAIISNVEKKVPTVPEPFDITDSKKAPILPESLMDGMDDTANVSVSLLPYGGLAMQVKRHATKVQPFSFDSRDKAKMKQKQEKIQKVLEEEKNLAEFHARPMPVFEDGVHGVPPKKPLTPTQAKPFTMRVDQRGTAKQEKFKQQLEEETQKEAEQRLFHAQGDQVVHKMPFLPGKSKKPLTEILNITLKSELRASERSDFDRHRKEAEEEEMAARKREEECRAAEELAEVARLRQETVHKAQPMPNYKPMIIRPASQPPTNPESPAFATTSRLRSRSRANSTFSL